MPIKIRSATLDADRQDLIELFRRHLTPLSDDRRFEWLYRSNPHGPAHVWVACDSARGEIVGAAAAFPRKMYLRGIEKMAWVFGDFCLEEKYRSLGPALQLQRAGLEAGAELPVEFCYDFPSQSMMAIYKRLGVSENGKLVRWAKPLRIERKIEPVVRSRILARGLGAIGNLMLKRPGWGGEKHVCQLVLQEGPCGEEFSELDRQLRGHFGVRTARTAEYLNWRYLAHPTAQHEIMTAQRKGTLIGYAVFTRQGEDANIVDICSIEEPAVIERLLTGVVRHLNQGGVATVSMAAVDLHPWSGVFEAAGFRRREASPVVVWFPRGASANSHEFRNEWHLMQGERDS